MRKTERVYTILYNPIVTEKTAQFGEGDKVQKIVFRVAPFANKSDVKEAVETLFKVKVKSVNSLWRKGKRTNFRQRAGKRADMKRAIITLQEGQTLDALAAAQSGK